MTFNSDEVNFLVYRYLEESGFHHSAYMFGFESSVLNAGIETTLVPRGALMSLLQKGILFAEAELFSMLTEGEIDSKFEKAIGTMSLIECCSMSDSSKLRAYERKMRDESSRTCSPHPGTSASATANPTPQPAHPNSSAADSASSMDLSQAVSSALKHTGNTADTSSNGSQFLPSAAKVHQQQQQLIRDREYRAKQTVGQTGPGGPGPPHVPPRGAYRTPIPDGQSKPQFPPITSAATLQYLQTQSLNHVPPHDLPVTSAGFAFPGGGDNGISLQYLKQPGNQIQQIHPQGKLADCADNNFLTPSLQQQQQQQQQRFLVTNGSYQPGAAAGGIGVGVKRPPAGGPGAAVGNNSGSVFDISSYK